MSGHVAIAGAGIFGAAAALQLVERGYRVTLIDPGPLPHPLAASTDISKLVRMDYGADRFYMALMETALSRWEDWNKAQDRPLYHADGLLALSRGTLAPGGFEHDSLAALRARGHAATPLDAAALKRNFPAWNASIYPNAYFNPHGGWAESGAVVAWLIDRARARGVALAPLQVTGLVQKGDRARGFRCGDAEILADRLVCALGAWTPAWLPATGALLRAVGQPVLHFQPADPRPWQAPRFPPWAADIARTGWYGFPANADGLVKVANHGPGQPMRPEDPRQPAPAWDDIFRAFLRESLPDLADAPIVGRRLCLYCDTADGDFLIDEHPDTPGLILATGGSGHAFKFAPLLGDWIADRVEGAPPIPRFAWRAVARPATEHARCDPDRA